MTKEVLKMARTALGVQLDALLGKAGHLHNDDRRRYAEQGIKAIDEALAKPEQEPVGKLQEATAERVWLTIDELNAWADKKLSENPHWVMPKDESERDEPHPQRTWVWLSEQERNDLEDYCEMIIGKAAFDAIEAKLRSKNGY